MTRPSSVVSPDVDAEPLLEVREDALRAREMAGQVVAHGHHVTALGLLEEERVEGDDLVHVRRAQIEERRDVRLDLERDVAERVLRHVEHGQERAALVGVEPLQPPDFGELLG